MEPIIWSETVTSDEGSPPRLKVGPVTIDLPDGAHARNLLAGLRRWEEFERNPQLVAMIHDANPVPLLKWLIDELTEPMPWPPNAEFHVDLLGHAVKLYDDHTAEQSPLISLIVDWARKQARQKLRDGV